MRTEFMVEYRLMQDAFAVAMRQGTPGQWAYAQVTMVMRDAKEADHPIEPSFMLTREAAQGLMDDLWRAGVRPSNGEGATGQLASTREHLADMRKLVEFMANENGTLALGDIKR